MLRGELLGVVPEAVPYAAGDRWRRGDCVVDVVEVTDRRVVVAGPNARPYPVTVLSWERWVRQARRIR